MTTETERSVARRRGLVVFPSLAIVVAVSCTSAAPVSSTSDLASTFERKSPTTTVAPKGAAARSVSRAVAAVRVARERPSGYKRTLFRHWTDDDRNGCSAREDVLIAESLSPAQVDPFGCKVIEGDWYSPYDGLTHTDPAELDIDHVVPLKEAWDSGAHSWSAARRRAFANDMSDPRSLIAVTSSVNRSKGDKDPTNWMPPNRADWCRYIADWVAIKARWGLTMDQSEHGRITKLAKGECAKTTVAAWGKGRGASLTSTPPSSTSPGGSSPSTTIAAPDTSPDATAGAPTTPVKGDARLVTAGAFCGKADLGAVGVSKTGKSYVCSTTDVTGKPYAGGRSRWRPVE
jgi:hypothetical protein